MGWVFSRPVDNQGTIFERGDGRGWQAGLMLPNGKRKWFYGKTEKEAWDKLFEGQKAL
jgi:hypothetical protein